MPLEIECSDIQPGDFQRIPFLHTFSVTKKKTKSHYLMNLRRYDLRSTNIKNTKGNAQRLPTQTRPTAMTRTQIPRYPGPRLAAMKMSQTLDWSPLTRP